MPSSDVDSKLWQIVRDLLETPSSHIDKSDISKGMHRLEAWSDRRTAAVLQRLHKFADLPKALSRKDIHEFAHRELAALSPKSKQPSPAAHEGGVAGKPV